VRKHVVAVVAVVAIALAAVSVAVAGSTTLKISAQKTALKYNVTKLKATAGAVTIAMANPSAIFKHNVAIKGNGLKQKGKVVGKGGISKVVVTLKPGKYTFYCSVAGHEAGGMKGTLTVTK
jgi:plastocyanin